MTRLRPGDFAPRWPSERAARRLLSRVSMLFVHGFLTDGEKRRVLARLVKWVD